MNPRPVSWLLDDPARLPWTAYELQLALALCLGLAFVLNAPALQRVARARLLAVTLATAMSGLVGAVLLPWLAVGAPPVDALAQLQLVAYAGAAGGLVAAVASAMVLSVPLAPLLDVLAPASALGLALARIGCFVAGCDYGLPSSAWWAVRYPSWALASEPRVASAALVDHVARGLVPQEAAASLPVVPVQLLESLLGLALFAALVSLGPGRSGRRPLVLAVGYGIGRFLLELLRGDADRGIQLLGTPWSTSQWASLVLIGAVLAVVARRALPSNPAV